MHFWKKRDKTEEQKKTGVDKMEEHEIMQNELEENEENQEETISVSQLLQCDVAILEGLQTLCDKMCDMDAKISNIDKSNKKFLMSASNVMQKTELLEREIEEQKKKMIEQKLKIISLLDQIYMLLSVAHVNKSEDLKRGLALCENKVSEIVSDLGIEEIVIRKNSKFNSKEQECAESVHLEEYEDDVVVSLLQKGYKDKDSGNILRFAKVSVNKREEK